MNLIDLLHWFHRRRRPAVGFRIIHVRWHGSRHHHPIHYTRFEDLKVNTTFTSPAGLKKASTILQPIGADGNYADAGPITIVLADPTLASKVALTTGYHNELGGFQVEQLDGTLPQVVVNVSAPGLGDNPKPISVELIYVFTPAVVPPPPPAVATEFAEKFPTVWS